MADNSAPAAWPGFPLDHPYTRWGWELGVLAACFESAVLLNHEFCEELGKSPLVRRVVWVDIVVVVFELVEGKSFEWMAKWISERVPGYGGIDEDVGIVWPVKTDEELRKLLKLEPGESHRLDVTRSDEELEQLEQR
eukprot:jgi/Chrzof1/9340/UNPLg00311.t1